MKDGLTDCPYDLYDAENFYLAELFDRDLAKYVINGDKCPSCKNIAKSPFRVKFCPHCGQRLRWEK